MAKHSTNDLSKVKQALNSPKLKGAALTGLNRASLKLKEMDDNVNNPSVNTLTGKPTFTDKDRKVNNLFSKVPSGSFAKASNIINKVSSKIEE